MPIDRENPWGAKVPENLTHSFKLFSSEAEIIEFSIVYLKAADKLFEQHHEELKEELKDFFLLQDNDVTDAVVDKIEEEGARGVFSSATYEVLHSQMAFARINDNFITYLKDLLGEVIKKQPNILKSSKDKRTFEFISDFDDIDELKQKIANQKIEELFYHGIDDIEQFFKDRLGIEIFGTEDERLDVSEFIQLRNSIVHNRGRVTEELKNNIRDLNLDISDFVFIHLDKFSDLNIRLHNIAVEIDRKIAKKFDLDLIENPI